MITCQTTKEAWNLKQADGITWHGQKIATRYVYPPQSSSNSSTGLIETLGQLVRSRYDPNFGFLNLDQFTQDSTFQATGSKGFSQDPSQSKFGPVLCKLIGQICPQVDIHLLFIIRFKRYPLHPIVSLPSSFSTNCIHTFPNW